MNPILLLLISIIFFSCSQIQQQEDLLVGASAHSITPPTGAYIAGDKINRQFEGVHDSLFVKAVVITNDTNSLTILTYDCIGLLYPTLLKVREATSQAISDSSFDPSHIVMTSTHTHSGPDVVGIWGPEQLISGVDSAYMRKLIQASVNAITQAWENRQAAKAVYAQTSFGDDWVYNISDSLNLDRSLTILQFLDNQNQSIATLNNFACHPTIMDAASNQVSADYVSTMYTYLDQSVGGVNLFLQGAIGGWVQPEFEPKTFESVEKRGSELGKAIEQALNKSIKLEGKNLTFQSDAFNLPVSNPNFIQLSQLGVIQRVFTDSVKTEIAWFSIGNAQFVTHPGETSPTHSLASKKLMTNTGPKFVLGLGMDALGYILTPDFYEENPTVKHSEYLQSMSIDPQAGAVMMKRIEGLAGDK